MPRTTPRVGLPATVLDHLENVAANLQLVADLWYGDAALAVAGRDGDADRPRRRPPEHGGRPHPGLACRTRARARGRARGLRRRSRAASRADTRAAAPAGGGTRTTEAYPIGLPEPTAVVLRTFGEQIEQTTSRMENAFIDAARDLLADAARRTASRHAHGAALLDPAPRRRRRLRVSTGGRVTYASPNAVSIMRNAGVEARVTGMHASELPGGGLGIAPLLGASGALATELEVAERMLGYRSLALASQRAGAGRGPHRGAPPRARAGRQGGDHPRGPPPGQEQPADHRLAAAHAGAAERGARTSGARWPRPWSAPAPWPPCTTCSRTPGQECVDFAEVARRVVVLVERASSATTHGSPCAFPA